MSWCAAQAGQVNPRVRSAHSWTIHHSARLSGACWQSVFGHQYGFTFDMSDRYTYSGNGAVLGAALASNSYYGLVLRCKAVMRQNTIRVTSKKVNYAVCFMRNLS